MTKACYESVLSLDSANFNDFDVSEFSFEPGVEKGNISSLNSNFSFLDRTELNSFHEKTANCGVESYNLIGFSNGEISQIELPVYCNNRACVNDGCKEHRGYLYLKNHGQQIDYLKRNINVPKAYIFTG